MTIVAGVVIYVVAFTLLKGFARHKRCFFRDVLRESAPEREPADEKKASTLAIIQLTTAVLG